MNNNNYIEHYLSCISTINDAKSISSQILHNFYNSDQINMLVVYSHHFDILFKLILKYLNRSINFVKHLSTEKDVLRIQLIDLLKDIEFLERTTNLYLNTPIEHLHENGKIKCEYYRNTLEHIINIFKN